MSYFELIQKAYQDANVEQKRVVDSNVLPTCVRKAVDIFNLDKDHYKNLLSLCALFVLGNIDETITLDEMKKLAIPDSKIVFDTIQICIKNTPIIDTRKEKHTDLYESNLADDIAETEAALTALSTPQNNPPSADANQTNDEPVYSTTQEAILREGKRADNNDVRWGQQ